MSLNLEQSNVSLEDPQFLPMLKNLQANILKGHGRDFAIHLFFKLNPLEANDAKTWIKSFAVTTAFEQLETTALFNSGEIADGGPVQTLSLSSTGYDALSLRSIKPQSSQLFKNGMKADAADLGDDMNLWDTGFQGSVDLLIIVADDDKDRAFGIANGIINEVGDFASLLHIQLGRGLKMANGIGIEHFGYADGISQPLYIKDEIDRQPVGGQWTDKTDLIRILVEDLPAGKDNFGSFLVFRKLEQNIKAFKEAETSLPEVLDGAGIPNPELAGAMLVGRFENGVPVVKTSSDFKSNPPGQTNDFNYSDDKAGLKCPFHSHIRLMTPRDGDEEAGSVLEQRITRRGIPYDDAGRFSDTESFKLTKPLLERNHPTEDVGLLFMCYQSNIDSQFSILQKFWANQGKIKTHDVNGQDSLIGQGTNPEKKIPEQWGQSTKTEKVNFPKVVTTKGGEYFFTPSVTFLSIIDQL